MYLINMYSNDMHPHMCRAYLVPCMNSKRAGLLLRSRTGLLLRYLGVSQRSLHNAPIFRLLLKVAVNGTHQCDFPNFCGAVKLQQREVYGSQVHPPHVWCVCGGGKGDPRHKQCKLCDNNAPCVSSHNTMCAHTFSAFWL